VSKDGAMFPNLLSHPPLSVRMSLCLALVLVAGLCGEPATSQAQSSSGVDWNNTGDPLHSAIGLHYGQLGGHGLAFRAPLRWWLYAQIAGGVWHTADRQQHNLGFNLNYILRQDQRVRVFINVGTAYFYDKEKLNTTSAGDVHDLDKNWNLGGGVGIEYLQGRRWSWKLEADFAHLGKSGDIKVVPQAGIAYYW